MKPTNPEAVRACIVKALQDVLGEKAAEADLQDDVKPIGNLGLDSMDGLDYACELSEALGFKLPTKENPLVDDGRQRARTIGDIVVYVCDQMKIKPSATHAS
jgi:acyl carrier protein